MWAFPGTLRVSELASALVNANFKVIAGVTSRTADRDHIIAACRQLALPRLGIVHLTCALEGFFRPGLIDLENCVIFRRRYLDAHSLTSLRADDVAVSIATYHSTFYGSRGCAAREMQPFPNAL